PELVDEIGEPSLVALVLLEHPRVRRLGLSLLERPVALDPEVPEQLLPVQRGVVERLEHSRFHVVRVVAQRPSDQLVGRPGAVPLLRRHLLADEVRVLHLALERLRAYVAERLVEAPDPVVIVRERKEISRPPAVPKAPGPDSGKPVGLELADLVLRE